MQVSKRGGVALLSAAALAGAATTAVSAVGSEGHGGNQGRDHHRLRGEDRGHRDGILLDTSLAPSVPSDPMLNGATAGGAPWVLRNGEARLRRDGRLRVEIRGLVIPVAPGNGTPGPVTTVNASLYCGASTTPAGSTPSAPISRRGNAELAGSITVPAKCLAPTVLIHPNGSTAAYIAASGFGG